MISVIIPIRYRADLAQVCLDSVLNYTPGAEVIAVQEGEEPDVTNLLTKYPQITVVHNKTPKGFSGAMNTGITAATGDYYCFLNSDTVVTPGWMDEMMGAFDWDPDIGLVTPTYTEMFGLQSIERVIDKQYEFVDEPASLKGVCFLIPKRVIDLVGDWDERFGMGGGDDNDICYRIHQAKFKLAIARKAFIYHYGSASFRELFHNDNDYSKRYAVGQFNKFRAKHKIKGKPVVFISIPCVSGTIHHELALRLVQWSHDPDIMVKIRFYPHTAPLDNARNLAVKEFLEDYCDYFFHVDDDIVPPTNTLRELMLADKAVIAPLCFTVANHNGMQLPIIVAHRYNKQKEYEPYYPDTSKELVHETDVVTGGCHLVKREVFEKLERPYYFTYHKNGTVIYSEDFIFSQQCQKLGYKLYTHYGLPCKHLKLMDVKNLNDVLTQTPSLQIVK